MPGFSSKKRRLEADTWEPDQSREEQSQKKRKHFKDNKNYGRAADNTYRPQYNDGDSGRQSHVGSYRHPRPFRPEHDQPNNHRKSYRSNNPSTRIKSIRKQLQHKSAATLPADKLAEKERELAFLEAEQKQKFNKKGRSKTIGRYHMVRFFERKKAERTLKRLRKQLQNSEGDQPLPTQEDLYRAETDLVYTLCTPLEDKYFAIFAADPELTRKAKKHDEHHAPKKNPKSAKGPEVIKLSDTSLTEYRPAQWLVVDAILKKNRAQGDEDIIDTLAEAATEQIPSENDKLSAVMVTPAQLQELEALRDGRIGSTKGGIRAEDLPTRDKKKQTKQSGDQRPAWQTATDDAIDPMDADSDDEEYDEDGGMALDGRDEAAGSESDGDGGFFE